MAGCRLAIAATDDPAVNREVSTLARARGVPVNVVDQPELCSFVVPSIIDRSPVIAAVSTGGASPVLARLIRARLESLIPAGYGRLADLANRFRERVKQRFSEPADRRHFWERVLEGGVAERVFSGHLEEADAAMERALAERTEGTKLVEVYLVGGGTHPGSGLPVIFEGARITAKLVGEDLGLALPKLVDAIPTGGLTESLARAGAD